ncbi:MAG TPA: hypothetical protein VGP07_06760 [Polyangia bacterium]|jgi:hypothetical protein
MLRTHRSSTPAFRFAPPLSVALFALVIGLVLGAPTPARADGMKGKIAVSDAEFGTGFGSDADMMKAVKKQSKPAIKGEGGAWTLNLMVFLKEAPGATTINIVYYDVSVKPRDQVNFSEVKVQTTQKIVQVNGVSISKDLGFVKGHKYEVLATRIIGGKEKVYAKGTVSLK